MFYRKHKYREVLQKEKKNFKIWTISYVPQNEVSLCLVDSHIIYKC